MIACIGNGSTKDASTRLGFTIVELILQSVSLVLVVFQLAVFGDREPFFLIVDITTIICSFVGLNLEDQSIARYFLSLRALKLICAFRFFPQFHDELERLTKSLKVAGRILPTILLLILIYAVAGLYCFQGINCVI